MREITLKAIMHTIKPTSVTKTYFEEMEHISQWKKTPALFCSKNFDCIKYIINVISCIDTSIVSNFKIISIIIQKDLFRIKIDYSWLQDCISEPSQNEALDRVK